MEPDIPPEEKREKKTRWWRQLATAPLLFFFRIIFRVSNRSQRQWLAKIPLLAPFYHRMARFLSLGTGSEGPIAKVHGFTMYLDPQEDAGRNAAFLWSEFEPATLAVFTRLLTRGDTIIDVGAHWGYYTLLAASRCGESGKVFAFEPHPRNFALLTRNIEVNQMKNVQAIPKAVSDQSGKAVLFESWFTMGHSLRPLSGLAADGRPVAHELSVETVTLDDFFGDGSIQPRLIKMDIEGAEPLALAGMNRLIRRSPQLMLIMEFNPAYMGAKAGEFLEMFVAQGFEFVIVDDERRKMELGPKGEILKKVLNSGDVSNLLFTRQMQVVAPLLGFHGAVEGITGSLKTVHIHP